MKDDFYTNEGFEDISSSTVPHTKSSIKAVTENYGNGVFRHLDKIIKAISFIVSIGILLVFAAAGAVLIMLDKIFAIELGLSSDTYLADTISELETRTFLTNSDAHSLPKIAREYNKIAVEDISFKEIVKALKKEDGRKVIANYGLDPKLGKYHRTYCDDCQKSIETKEPVEKCPMCGGKNVTFGVFDRIELIKDKQQTKSPKDRPPYIYQIPLGFIPGVGGKTISKLLNTFETEMNILHKLSKDDIEMVVGEKIANNIENARNGNAKIHSGVEEFMVRFQ